MRAFLITVAVLFATSVAFAAPPMWSAPAAAAHAERDIREHKIKICLWGGYSPQPVGIPDQYRRLIRQYPTVMVGQGCTVSDEAQISASANTPRRTTLACLNTFCRSISVLKTPKHLTKRWSEPLTGA
jgi:hypothetical protein